MDALGLDEGDEDEEGAWREGGTKDGTTEGGTAAGSEDAAAGGGTMAARFSSGASIPLSAAGCSASKSRNSALFPS